MRPRKIDPFAAALAFLLGSAVLTPALTQSLAPGANPGPKPTNGAPTTKGEVRAGATTK